MSDLAVTVSLEALKNGNIPFSTLEDAFGPGSLGIIIIKDVEPEFVDLRRRLLSYSSYLGNLPESSLKNLEIPAAKYLMGWSVGKEMLKNGQPDTLKGSYFANCAFYVDPKLSGSKPTLEFNEENFPQYLTQNLWPEESILPGFRETFQNLCHLIIDTGLLVARECDRYAANKIDDYPPGYLQHVIRTSMTTKARLLHYFPLPKTLSDEVDTNTGTRSKDDDDWCATHLDHCCLTGLTSAMFIDETENPPVVPPIDVCSSNYLSPLSELPSSPDPNAGLYIQSRIGNTVHLAIPKNCIAFQTGEALERITKGRFKAVPHYVKGVRPEVCRGSIARNTLAVFMQPNLEELVDIEMNIKYGEFARGIVQKYATK